MTDPEITRLITDRLKQLRESCAAAEGRDKATAWRNAIGPICVSNCVVGCVTIGDVTYEEHWLLRDLNKYIQQSLADAVSPADIKLDAFLEAVEELFATNRTSLSASKVISLLKAADRSAQKLPTSKVCADALKVLATQTETMAEMGIKHSINPANGASTFAAVIATPAIKSLPEPAPKPVAPFLPALPKEDGFSWPSGWSS